MLRLHTVFAVLVVVSCLQIDIGVAGKKSKAEHACRVTKVMLACTVTPTPTGILQEARDQLADLRCKEDDDEDGVDAEAAVCPNNKKIQEKVTIGGIVYTLKLCQSKKNALDRSLCECAGEAKGMLKGVLPKKDWKQLLKKGRKGSKKE